MSSAGRSRWSGQGGGVQSLDGLEDLDGQGVSRAWTLWRGVKSTDTSLSGRSDRVVLRKNGKFFTRVFTRTVDLSKVHTDLWLIGIHVRS